MEQGKIDYYRQVINCYELLYGVQSIQLYTTFKKGIRSLDNAVHEYDWMSMFEVVLSFEGSNCC